MQDNAPYTALLLDALYTVNCSIQSVLSVADIMTIVSRLGISEKVVRAGLKHPVFVKSLIPTKGRSKAVYRLPSPRQVRDWFRIYDHSEYSDILPLRAFDSVCEYRKHLHAAMVARLTILNHGAFKMARDKMAARLNVTIDTIRNYEQCFEILVSAHITAIELKTAQYWNLPAKHDGTHNAWLHIIKPDGTTRNYPLVRAVAAQAISHGCRVFKMRQHSNLYQFLGDCREYVQSHLLE